MGIGNFIQRICQQTAVYWGDPSEDGKGGLTFGSMYPIEILCRWEKRTEVLSMLGGGRKSEELISKALVMVVQDVDEQGYLFLGTLDDLNSDEEDNPQIVKGAYRIQKFDKIPAVRHTEDTDSDDFIRKAYL